MEKFQREGSPPNRKIDKLALTTFATSVVLFLLTWGLSASVIVGTFEGIPPKTVRVVDLYGLLLFELLPSWGFFGISMGVLLLLTPPILIIVGSVKSIRKRTSSKAEYKGTAYAVTAVVLAVCILVANFYLSLAVISLGF